jgi:signal peptidase I
MTNSLSHGDWAFINKTAYARPSLLMIPFIGRYLEWAEEDKIIDSPNIKRSDVIMFFHKGTYFTKRVIGLSGDLVEIIENGDGTHEVKVNGETTIFNEKTKKPLFSVGKINIIHDDGMKEEVPQYTCRLKVSNNKYSIFRVCFAANHKKNKKSYRRIVIPKGYIFCMGDNRNNSGDCRFFDFGPIPKNNVVGRIEGVFFGSDTRFATSSTFLKKYGGHITEYKYRNIVAWVQFLLELAYSMVRRFMQTNFSRFHWGFGEYKSLNEVNAMLKRDLPLGDDKSIINTPSEEDASTVAPDEDNKILDLDEEE